MRLNEAYTSYKDILNESVQNNVGNTERDSVIKNSDDSIDLFHRFKNDGVLISEPDSRIKVYMRISDEPLTLSETKEQYPTSNKRIKGIWYLPLKTEICRYLPCLKSYSDLNKFIWMDKKDNFNKQFEKKGLPLIKDFNNSEIDEADNEFWTGTLSEYGKHGNNVNFFGFGHFAPNPIFKYGTNIERKHRAILLCRL